MMNRHSEALEEQMRSHGYLLRAYSDPRLRPRDISDAEVHQWLTDMHALQRATPFYWNTRTVDLVTQAALDFDLSQIAVSRHVVYNDVAWHYFAEKSPFGIELRSKDMPNRIVPVRAITWYYFNNNGKPYLGCTAWCQTSYTHDWSPAGPLCPVVWGCVDEGDIASKQLGSEDVNFFGMHDERTLWEIDQMLRFILAASTFLRQEIFAAPKVPLERQARKRMVRAGNKPLDIAVVQLRRAAAGSGGGAEGTPGDPREYDFCWSVRGHVRQQPYPTLGIKLPLYIHGYLKGDLDKPLKPRTTPLYSVTR